MEAIDRTRKVRFDAFEVDMRSGEVRKHGIRLKLHHFSTAALVSKFGTQLAGVQRVFPLGVTGHAGVLARAQEKSPAGEGGAPS